MSNRSWRIFSVVFGVSFVSAMMGSLGSLVVILAKVVGGMCK